MLNSHDQRRYWLRWMEHVMGNRKIVIITNFLLASYRNKHFNNFAYNTFPLSSYVKITLNKDWWWWLALFHSCSVREHPKGGCEWTNRGTKVTNRSRRQCWRSCQCLPFLSGEGESIFVWINAEACICCYRIFKKCEKGCE